MENNMVYVHAPCTMHHAPCTMHHAPYLVYYVMCDSFVRQEDLCLR
uniref:Uncharacterized protein n=1 Tax=Anguilla anguilla TaxID=7936 RepID=A0A0E9WFR4_ANGAN